MEQKSQFEHQLDPEEYYFSNQDPYAKPETLPPERAERRFFWGEDGHIHVKNLSAFWNSRTDRHRGHPRHHLRCHRQL